MTREMRWIRSDGRGKPEVLRTNVDMEGESGLRRMPDCMVCTDCTLQQDPAQIGQTRLTRGMAQNPRRKDRCVESWTWEERVMAQATGSQMRQMDGQPGESDSQHWQPDAMDGRPGRFKG